MVPVILSVSEMEQSLYTLEMCVATLMEKTEREPMTTDKEHIHMYSELLSSTQKMRTALVEKGVVLEAPMYLIYMQAAQPDKQIQLSA